jgi:acyl-coenzyme A thioesterase PaaI-like protein
MPSHIASRTYGTASADKQKEMTGLEFVQGLAEGTLPLNTIAKTLGYDITEAESGRVVATAEPKDIHLNPAGTVHGDLAATMLDSCMGLAIQSTLAKGSAPRPLRSRYHSSGRSHRRQVRSRLRAR